MDEEDIPMMAMFLQAEEDGDIKTVSELGELILQDVSSDVDIMIINSMLDSMIELEWGRKWMFPFRYKFILSTKKKQYLILAKQKIWPWQSGAWSAHFEFSCDGKYCGETTKILGSRLFGRHKNLGIIELEGLDLIVLVHPKKKRIVVTLGERQFELV